MWLSGWAGAHGPVSHRKVRTLARVLVGRWQGRLPAGCRLMTLTFLQKEHLAPLSPDRGEGGLRAIFARIERTSTPLGCRHAAERLGGSPRLCFAPKVPALARAMAARCQAPLPAGCRHAAEVASGWAGARDWVLMLGKGVDRGGVKRGLKMGFYPSPPTPLP